MTSPGEEPIVQVRTVEDLMEMAHGYQRSMVLFAAMDLGVFSALAGRPSAPASLARRLCAAPRRLAILLNALVGVGLLGKRGKVYRNGEIANRFLADGPASKASILLHHLNCWTEWTRLPHTVRAGGTPPRTEQGDPEKFSRGVEGNARARAALA